MANITVNDIKPTGVELFADSESFMKDLGDHDLAHILGGGFTLICITNGRTVA